MKSGKHHIDYCLDITQDVCPMTFVKARLQIEKMSAGQILEIRLKGAEPLKNVPDSLIELGHDLVSVFPEDAGADIHRVVIRKN